MPKSKPPAPMSIQPASNGSSMPTQSLPQMPGIQSTVVSPGRDKRQPDGKEIRAGLVREGIRLDALKKQRRAMKRNRASVKA
jgi:hypothetical protein